VNRTNFWNEDGFGLSTVRVSEPEVSLASVDWFEIAGGVKISDRSVASSRHFLSSPLRLIESASASNRLRVSISIRNSAMLRAAVAWSRISSSAASTSLSGASSRSSTSSESRSGVAVARVGTTSPPRWRISNSRKSTFETFSAAPQGLINRFG
jgi:hypothetical protein